LSFCLAILFEYSEGFSSLKGISLISGERIFMGFMPIEDNNSNLLGDELPKTKFRKNPFIYI
tara:strand:+ start:115 stop:300 length:186 start_codon:yes stop_codon:yes gene_type:complete